MPSPTAIERAKEIFRTIYLLPEDHPTPRFVYDMAQALDQFALDAGHDSRIFQECWDAALAENPNETCQESEEKA